MFSNFFFFRKSCYLCGSGKILYNCIGHGLQKPRLKKNSHTHTHTHTHSVDFPLQQWFHERPLMLCYTYIASKLRSRNCFSAVCFLSLCVGNVKFIGYFVLHASGSALCSLTERKNELRKERLFNHLTFPPRRYGASRIFSIVWLFPLYKTLATPSRGTGSSFKTSLGFLLSKWHLVEIRLVPFPCWCHVTAILDICR
jgi:hypothetical protein